MPGFITWDSFCSMNDEQQNTFLSEDHKLTEKAEKFLEEKVLNYSVDLDINIGRGNHTVKAGLEAKRWINAMAEEIRKNNFVGKCDV